MLLLGMLQVALVGRDQLAVELAAREAARAAAVSADPVAAARLAAERVTTLRPLQVAVTEGGATVTVTVTHPSATDVALVGHVIADVELRATVTMAVEPPARPEVGPTAVGTLAGMDLRARHDVVGTLPVVALSGSVDLATVPQLTTALYRLIGDHAGARVAVDLDGVDVLDDTGLGVLLGAAGRARQAGGELVVVVADERLQARFEATGFDRAVDVVDRLAAVLTS